jgi:uncharacterized membrane protein (DUF106 family)
MLDSFFNSIFGWAVNMSPLAGIIFVSFILTLLSTLAYKLFTDQKLMKDVKDEMKDIRKEMKEFAHDPAKVAELQKRSLEKSANQMKQSFKPMLITIIPFLLVFNWLRTEYGEMSLAVDSWWFISSWFWTYFIFTMVFSIVLRKLLKVH